MNLEHRVSRANRCPRRGHRATGQDTGRCGGISETVKVAHTSPLAYCCRGRQPVKRGELNAWRGAGRIHRMPTQRFEVVGLLWGAALILTSGCGRPTPPPPAALAPTPPRITSTPTPRPIDLHGQDLRHRKFSGLNLKRANLSGANMMGVHLAHADLTGADLSNAKLSAANLRGTNLSHASLKGADLHGREWQYGVKLTGADMTNANLDGANLESANLQGASLELATLRGANLTNAILRGTHLPNSDLTDACFAGADLEDALMQFATLDNADFSTARHLREALLGNATYSPQTRWPVGFDAAKHRSL